MYNTLIIASSILCCFIWYCILCSLGLCSLGLCSLSLCSLCLCSLCLCWYCIQHFIRDLTCVNKKKWNVLCSTYNNIREVNNVIQFSCVVANHCLYICTLISGYLIQKLNKAREICSDKSKWIIPNIISSHIYRKLGHFETPFRYKVIQLSCLLSRSAKHVTR